MLSSILGNSFIVLVVLIFVPVVLLLESVYVTWRAHRGPQAMKLKSRLNALSATHDNTSQTRLLRQRMLSELPPMERFLQRLPRMRQLDKAILQSGLAWSVSSVLLACLVLFAAGWAAVAMGLHQPLTMAAAAGVVMGALPFGYIRYRRRKRLEKFERQLPEALDLITRALRAGHAFPGGAEDGRRGTVRTHRRRVQHRPRRGELRRVARTRRSGTSASACRSRTCATSWWRC